MSPSRTERRGLAARRISLATRTAVRVLPFVGVLVCFAGPSAAAPGELANLSVAAAPAMLSKVGVETLITLTVANAGPQAAADVVVEVTLGDGVAGVTAVNGNPFEFRSLVPAGFASLRPSVGTCTTSIPATCQLGTIVAGDVEAVELKFRPTSVSTFLLVGSVTSSTAEVDTTDNLTIYFEFLGTSASPYVGDRPPYIANFRAPSFVRPSVEIVPLRAEPAAIPDSYLGALWVEVSENVDLRLVFDRQHTGRLVGGRCVVVTRRTVHRPRCTRYVRSAVERVKLLTGWNRVAFTGWMRGPRLLAPGRYRVTVTPTDVAGLRGPGVIARTNVRPIKS